MDEVPYEDKCATIDSYRDGKRIWTINQQADRAIRNELATEMRQLIDRLEAIDLPEMLQAVEEEAVRFEKAFLGLFEDNEHNESKAPKVPVFNFSPSLWTNSNNLAILVQLLATKVLK